VLPFCVHEICVQSISKEVCPMDNVERPQIENTTKTQNEKMHF
jgi:hypothetical protein